MLKLRGVRLRRIYGGDETNIRCGHRTWILLYTVGHWSWDWLDFRHRALRRSVPDFCKGILRYCPSHLMRFDHFQAAFRFCPRTSQLFRSHQHFSSHFTIYISIFSSPLRNYKWTVLLITHGAVLRFSKLSFSTTTSWPCEIRIAKSKGILNSSHGKAQSTNPYHFSQSHPNIILRACLLR